MEVTRYAHGYTAYSTSSRITSATRTTEQACPPVSFYQELVLYPQLVGVISHLSHPRTLHWTQRLLRLSVIPLPLIHSVAQRALIDLKLTGNLGNRAPSLHHEHPPHQP